MQLHLLLLIILLSAAGSVAHRRLLHQPLFPTTSISNPPYPSPAPQPLPQLPKYPFSTFPPPDTTPQGQNPFFPFFPSPPQPADDSSSATPFPTFPANISSLVIPATSHSSHTPIKVISLIVSISLFSTLVLSSLLLLLRRHHHHHHEPLKSDSLRLFPPDTTPSDTTTASAAVDPSKKPPSPLFPRHTSTSTSSSEFLYLGNLFSSRDADYSGQIAAPAATPAAAVPQPNAKPSPSYQRLGSPELHPLPPLPRQQSNQNYQNATVTSSDADENDREDDDEFFSPRGSTGNKSSPNPNP